MARPRINAAGDHNPVAWLALAGFGIWALMAWDNKKRQEAILAPQVPLKGLYGGLGLGGDLGLSLGYSDDDTASYDMPILTREGYPSANLDPMLAYAQSEGLDPTAFIRN